jgi:hypothetical protein
MNDQIKFSCLSCGQHIECDVTESGRPMLCPSYHANLTVPLLMEQTPAPAPDPNAVPAGALLPPVSPRIRGQIYLCLPDDSKSYIAGSFTVILPKPKPAPQPTQ